MKILLDHCVHRRFAQLLIGHEVHHTSEMGWGELQNGKLLQAAEVSEFEVLVTVDKNLQHQQNISAGKLALITLNAGGIDLRAITPLADRLVTLLNAGVLPGSKTLLSSDSSPNTTRV